MGLMQGRVSGVPQLAHTCGLLLQPILPTAFGPTAKAYTITVAVSHQQSSYFRKDSASFASWFKIRFPTSFTKTDCGLSMSDCKFY